jgi:hypothetical protein
LVGAGSEERSLQAGSLLGFHKDAALARSINCPAVPPAAMKSENVAFQREFWKMQDLD